MSQRTIAYFSMEIALEAGIPTYAGGLGVLAGDTLRAAADVDLPVVGVTLLHRKGYFAQRLDREGWQIEEPSQWLPDDFLVRLDPQVSVRIEGRTVQVRCWRRQLGGPDTTRVPVYFLDTDLPGNSDFDRTLTDHLYGGELHYRLCQEVVLGIGGVKMLRALGHANIQRFHMNEGHSSLLVFALLEEQAQREGCNAVQPGDLDPVRQQCVFTTHTPVAAGHDRFPMDLVQRVLGNHPALALKDTCCLNDELSMTFLALRASRYVNGVSMEHGEVSRSLFGGRHVVDAITNGVHPPTWTAAPFRRLYDRYLPGWRWDNFSLRYALSIPEPDIWAAHMTAKRRLIDLVNQRAGAGMDPDVLTLGFARRATAYKRPHLLFHDVARLKRFGGDRRGLQVVYAGKAHPRDHEGKALIQGIVGMRRTLEGHVKVAYLEDYDMDLASLVTAGVDVWLNTPEPPLEASGTSGMKAALNGVPSLSVLDGWWIEGHLEGITGWAIGEASKARDSSGDAASLYEKLERTIVPMFYDQRDRFVTVMRHAIALNGSFFNTQRMLQEYVLKAYGRSVVTPAP